MYKRQWDGVRVVTSGIITDTPGLLEVFDAYKICIVADDVAHESRALKVEDVYKRQRMGRWTRRKREVRTYWK